MLAIFFPRIIFCICLGGATAHCPGTVGALNFAFRLLGLSWLDRLRSGKSRRGLASSGPQPIKAVDLDLQRVERLYALMPPPGRVGFWRAMWQWFAKLGEVKSSSDIVAFVLKILPPIIAAIAIPVVAITVFLFKGTIGWLYHNNLTLLLVIGTFCGSAVFFYFVWLYFQYRLHKRLIDSDFHKDFRILQNVSSGYIVSERKAVYAFRWIVTPRFDGVERFTVTHNWSGEGVVKVVPRNQRWKVNPLTKAKGNYSRSEIVFDEPLREGQQYSVEYALITPESSVLPSAHLGVSILNRKFPFFNSHLLIVFDTQCAPIAVRREYYLGGFSQRAVDTTIVNLNGDRAHHWSVKPQFNWSYCIAWDFGG